ncbi:MAG TPA: STAS domain-containing protein [Terriglobales bacterium]|jgi:anti-sigma B factor antagonist|nr:STAS domain-containing protein [Terriglobales bacterium]
MLFRIESERTTGAIILRCKGALVHGEPSTMLLHAGEKHGAQRLIVDLTGVDSIDASGLGALVGLVRWARRAGVCVRLLNPSKYVRELLRLTRLERVFEIVAADQEPALKPASAASAA